MNDNTPLTDLQEVENKLSPPNTVVDAEFARQLERRLNQITRIVVNLTSLAHHGIIPYNDTLLEIEKVIRPDAYQPIKGQIFALPNTP